MNDRGEKIVSLAYELLQSDVVVPEEQYPKVNISLRVLCLTALLSSSATGLTMEWAHQQQTPLNRYEKTELDALIFYTSRLKNLSENNLRSEVCQKLGLQHFEDITQNEFKNAQHYLQERAQ